MEISQSNLLGTCELLDVPLDDLQEFISQFNYAIADEFRPSASGSVQYFTDPTDIKRNRSILELKWKVILNTPEGTVEEGLAVFDLNEKRIQLRGEGHQTPIN